MNRCEIYLYAYPNAHYLRAYQCGEHLRGLHRHDYLRGPALRPHDPSARLSGTCRVPDIRVSIYVGSIRMRITVRSILMGNIGMRV